MCFSSGGRLPDQRWQCRWCATYAAPVPSINADHEARCPVNPNAPDPDTS